VGFYFDRAGNKHLFAAGQCSAGGSYALDRNHTRAFV
jgi:hypothetical protein